MAKRSFPDPTKSGFAAITMVYKDYFFLERWYRYYSQQFGGRHLYIISHGNDPEHRRIAPDANIIGVHRDPSMHRLERRRWALQTATLNGLLFYYNWIIVGDVDEIVMVDPASAPSLPDYLNRMQGQDVPRSLSPFGIELVHNPEVEVEEIKDDLPILQKRQVFRLNANYSKPCVIRHPTTFTPGGHANTHLPRVLDDNLYLVHLRFFDYQRSRERLESRRAFRDTMNDGKDTTTTGKAWTADLENFERLSGGKADSQTIDFPEFRKKMRDDLKLLHDGKVAFFGGGRSKTLYRLPERFHSIF